MLLPTDWGEMFRIETPVVELLIRAMLLYLCILAFMRILPRRTGGEIAHMDLIFMLLIAEAAAHSLGDYSSISEGLIVIAVMMGLNYLLNFLSFRVPAIERLISPPPLEIVRDGTGIRENLAREFITEDELLTHLRQNGITELSAVKLAMVEGKGKVSIITFEK
jgi:uncharacterized membrane protein YcaP (DUF421 family)